MDHNNPRDVLGAAKSIQQDVNNLLLPPPEGTRSQNDPVILRSVVRGTRGYVESIANQVNGCYERGWYDACAVMARRLLETLIIESYENYSIAAQIQDRNGNFFFLKDLIEATITCSSWNLTRNTKAALPQLKDLGDRSAHSRRFIAHRGDIDKVIPDLRVVIQELLFLAGLK